MGQAVLGGRFESCGMLCHIGW